MKLVWLAAIAVLIAGLASRGAEARTRTRVRQYQRHNGTIVHTHARHARRR